MGGDNSYSNHSIFLATALMLLQKEAVLYRKVRIMSICGKWYWILDLIEVHACMIGKGRLEYVVRCKRCSKDGTKCPIGRPRHNSAPTVAALTDLSSLALTVSIN